MSEKILVRNIAKRVIAATAAQPLILNDQRQAGAAIEGVIRYEVLDIAQLVVDTHGHTDFAMALAKLLGFDLCPRLKVLKDRHPFLPRGMTIPGSVQEICRASVDLGSASRADPLYEAIFRGGWEI